ncbi:MAG: PqqD family peptide modification chaperone [Geminicoccaceae bacterium]
MEPLFSEFVARDEEEASRFVAAPFLDDMVVHDVHTGRLFQVNHTAAEIWTRLWAGEPEDVIVGDLAASHGLDASLVQKDLQPFIKALKREDLVGSSGPLDGEWDCIAQAPSEDVAMLDALYRVGKETVRIVCHSSDVAAAFAPLAAPARVADHATAKTRLDLFPVGDGFVVTRDGDIVDKAGSAPAARWALVQQLVLAAGEHPYLALLHAGAVITPAGGLLICGESGAGKSTLLAGLVHAGFGFAADDVVPIQEQTMQAHPVRLAMSVKQKSWDLLTPFFPRLLTEPPIEFGGRTMRYHWPGDDADRDRFAAFPVKAVLFPRFDAEAAVSLRRLDPARSLALLGEGGSELPSTNAGLAQFLAWWRDLPAYQLSYGRLDEGVREVLDLAEVTPTKEAD